MHKVVGTGSICFLIVGKDDNPIFETQFVQKRESFLNHFILHAALDVVDEKVWATSST